MRKGEGEEKEGKEQPNFPDVKTKNRLSNLPKTTQLVSDIDF